MKQGLQEATKLRAGEKAENEKSISEATGGPSGVNKAITILKEFYSNAFVQTGFTPEGAGADGQTVGDLAPDAGTSEYHGNQDAASGIMGMLDVIKSDFEATIEKTEAAESDADEEYTQYKTDTESDIGEKEGLIKSKTSEK